MPKGLNDSVVSVTVLTDKNSLKCLSLILKNDFAISARRINYCSLGAYKSEPLAPIYRQYLKKVFVIGDKLQGKGRKRNLALFFF